MDRQLRQDRGQNAGVDQHGPAAPCQPHVGEPDVAMHDFLLLEHRQPVYKLTRNRQDHVRGEAAAADQHLGKPQPVHRPADGHQPVAVPQRRMRSDDVRVFVRELDGEDAVVVQAAGTGGDTAPTLEQRREEPA